MFVNPYLSFEGRCEEALEFYKKAVGAKVTTLMRFKDSPEPCAEGQMPPGLDNKVMHSEFTIGAATLMATDGMCQEAARAAGFKGISLALTTASDAECKQKFEALAEGGQVQMPLTKTFFSSSFAVVVDRFGVNWMIVVEQKK
jgi:PhnB protein